MPAVTDFLSILRQCVAEFDRLLQRVRAITFWRIFQMKRERRSEAIMMRTTPTQRRIIEREAQRQERTIGDMVRVIVIAWSRQQQQRRAATEPAE
jgi:hypothetical protein